MRISYGRSHGRRAVGPAAFALAVGVTVLLLAMIAYGMIHEPERARSLLAERGYSDIRMLPRRTYQGACGRSRGVAPAFVATGPDGRQATGIVCTAPLFADVVVDG